MTDFRVDEVRLTTASQADVATGLIGWLSCTLNGSLKLDGLSLRRTLAGTLTVSYPARTDRLGARHAYVRPLSEETRRDLEAQVLGALGLAASASGNTQAESRP